MNKPVEEIDRLYRERKKANEPFMGRMREIAELANGEVHVVHPELDVNEKATVVNLFPGGLDALATRAASVQPDQSWPPLRDGFQAAEMRARDRRQAGLAWWDMGNIPLQDRSRFRFFFGFGCMPVTVMPTSTSVLDKRDIPHWRTRSPLTAYPSPVEDKTDMEPADAIFACRRSRAWLVARYGGAMARLDTGPRDSARPDDMFDVLEYIDCDEIVLCCAGRSSGQGGLYTPSGYIQASACVELERIPNRANMPLAVFPGRITLDRMQGALDQMLPAYHRAAKLDSLNLIAIARGIFPDTYVVGHPGDPQSPEIITDADGMMGIIGEVAHGQVITLGNMTAAAQATDMAIDRLERSQRLVAGLPSELGGESGSNIRTARRGEQVLGSAIDMPIQEAQEIMAASKEAELRRGVAIMKGWFGGTKTSFYVPRDGTKPKLLDYTPNETFETDDVDVKYSAPGTDVNGQMILIGQGINIGLFSEQTAREMSSFVEDPVLERDRVEIEGIRRALLTSLEQQATQGSLAPEQIALIAKIKWATHGELEDVVLEAHRQAQEQQAAQAQMTPGSPETQPGLGGGQPAQGTPPSPFSGPPSQPALSQILSTLRSPAAQGGPEQGLNQPPQVPPAMAGQ